MLVPTGYSEVVRKLSDSSSVSFLYLGSLLTNIPLEKHQIQQLERLTIQKIKHILIPGNFGELAGAKDFLSLLGVEKVDFGDDWIRIFIQLLDDERISIGVLYDMMPSLINGKINGVTPYEKVDFTQQLLLQNGFSIDEATDEYILYLWEMREMLIRIKAQRKKVQKVLDAYLGVDMMETSTISYIV